MPDQGCFAQVDFRKKRAGDILLREAWLLTGSRDCGEELLQEALRPTSPALGQDRGRFRGIPSSHSLDLAVDSWRWRREAARDSHS